MYKTTIKWKPSIYPPCKSKNESCDYLGVCGRDCETYEEYLAHKHIFDCKKLKKRNHTNVYHEFKDTLFERERHCTVRRR